MNKLIFTPVEINQNSRGCGKPIASISQNRISLNSESCKLINDIYSYEWVEVLSAQDDNKDTILALRFVKSKKSNTTNAIRPSRVKVKGKETEAINLNSKQLITKFFGQTLSTSTKKFNVEKHDENTLLINISKPN